MQSDITKLPQGLPAPVDDGRASHLVERTLPPLSLPSTKGTSIDLSAVQGTVAVFIFPRTGRPNVPPLVPYWDTIPGARGCTPQTCSFRDHFLDFSAISCQIFGLSTQDTEYQREMSDRLLLPFPILSDSEHRLTKALNLPTFDVEGVRLLRRLSWIAEDGIIKRVFYPVFPPDENALTMLSWLNSL